MQPSCRPGGFHNVMRRPAEVHRFSRVHQTTARISFDSCILRFVMHGSYYFFATAIARPSNAATPFLESICGQKKGICPDMQLCILCIWVTADDARTVFSDG